MRTIGYARVSSVDQDLTIQREQLREYGCDPVFTDKFTGTKLAGRDGLSECLSVLEAGDVFVVTRLDRLARSLGDLIGILQTLNEKGVKFKCLHQPLDTTTAEGRLFISIIGAFAEFETDIRKARQREGIEAAKKKGVYRGRSPTVDVDMIRALAAEGLTTREIGERLGIHRSSVRRLTPDLWRKGTTDEGPDMDECEDHRGACPGDVLG